MVAGGKAFGDTSCHPERSEGSSSPDAEILRFAQDDRQDNVQVRSREALSPNVWQADVIRTGVMEQSLRSAFQSSPSGKR